MPYQLLGTSHIAQQSIDEIKQTVDSYQPDIIAVELDKERAHSLLSGEQNKIPLAAIRIIGVRGYIFAKIAQTVQQKLGQSVGIAPGSEMKTALMLVAQRKLSAALIDQPIRTTLRNLSKNLTWKEKGRFVIDIIKGVISPKKQLEKAGFNNLDLTKVPAQEFIEKMVGFLQTRYPGLYKTLIEDRNRYMVKALVKLMHAHPDKKILVIVGAGHLKGMKELLRDVELAR